MSKRESDDCSLLKYLDSLVEELRKQVAPAIKGADTDAVHDARVVTRRLKAAMKLVEPAVSGRFRKPFNRVTKSLRHRLGPLRDMDVMLDHLGEFKQAKLQPAVHWLREHLRDLRDNAVQCATDEAPPARVLAKLGSWWDLRHEVADAKDKIDELLSRSVHLQLDAFVEQAHDLAAQRGGDPHQLRIAGKSLRYTLEMAREHGVRLSASITTLFKRMQTALGLWHDYVVLAEKIMCESAECDLALHDLPLQTQLLSLAQQSLRKAESQLKKMAALWQSRGDSLTQTIRAAFPLTKHPQVESLAEPAESSQSVPAESGSAPAA